MKKRARGKPGSVAVSKQKTRLWLAVIICLGLLALLAVFRRSPSAALLRYKPRPAGSVTFNKDIAPILFAHCAPCHRPGESAPFNLISYSDARSRAALIDTVTQNHSMPPWLPEDGLEQFLNTRRLTIEQIGLINQWAHDGAPEGKTSDLPPQPAWTEGWQAGPPDLVVTMPQTYILPAEGKDVYRNFIIPLPTAENRFIKAFEFRPSTKVIHHAFIRIDRAHESRRLAKESTPGFPGMIVPPSAETPAGHFLSWQPGRGLSPSPDGLAWTLPAGADIVVLMHMQPTGKPEPVRPRIGFYFTDLAPTNTPLKISLRSYDIDIPVGATNYSVEQTATLPVDADLLAVLPHAHYLGKTLEGFALLPDHSRKTLLRIPNWDFNWQSDFRFATPVHLPKGTTLGMHYLYDNSTNNLRNPCQQPVPVKYGLQTTQEMAELYFQVIARNDHDRDTLAAAANQYEIADIIRLARRRLHDDPADAEALLEIAKFQMNARNLARTVALVRRVIQIRPGFADAHYTLGVLLMDQAKLVEAEEEFLKAVRLDPQDFKAWNNLGLVCLNQGKLDEAAAHFQEALRVHPGDPMAKDNLDLVLKTKRQKSDARQ